MKEHWSKIFVGLFFIWGIIIICYYFLNFSNYGNSFFQALILIVALLILLANLCVLVKITLIVYSSKKGLYKLFIFEKNKIVKKINNFNTPIYYFPIILYIFAFIWIIWIYFNTHWDLRIFLNNIIVLILVSFLFLISFSLGCKLLKIFRYKTEYFLEKFIFSSALGFGILMFSMYLLGMFGLYYRSIAYTLIIFIALLMRKEIREFWNYIIDKNNCYKLKNLENFEKILLFLIPLILGIYVVGIFQQFPVGFDAQISYLSFPKSYVENHSIVNFPHWIYYGFPQNGEMLFTLGYLLYNFQVCLGIIYLFTILIVLAIFYFFKKYKIKGVLYATVFYLSLPPISFQNLEDHKIEIIFTFYVVLSYILFFNYLKSKNKKDLIIFSIICGIAAGLKYFFLGWYIIPLVIIFIIEILRKKLKISHFFIWGTLIFILMLPWFYKNIKFSGNPIDPVFSDKLAYKQKFYNSLGQGSQKYIVDGMRNETYLIWDDEQKKDLKYLLSIPFKVSFVSNKKYVSDSLNVGYLFILTIPIIFILVLKKIKYIKKEKLFFSLIFLLILNYIGWIYIGHLVIWYAIPIFVIFSILFSYIFSGRNKYSKFLLKVFFAVWLIAFINYQYLIREGRIYSVIYSGNLEKVPLYKISKYINNNVNEGKIIWGVDEVENYYLNNREVKFIPDNYLLAFSFLLKSKSESEVTEYLKDRNINYILWQGLENSENLSQRMLWTKMPNGSEEYANFTLDNYKRVIKFKNKHMDLVTKEGDYYLYKLKEE